MNKIPTMGCINILTECSNDLNNDDCYKFCKQYKRKCNIKIFSAEVLKREDNEKICDCIIFCQDNKQYLFVVEILDGRLTNSEYKDKAKQLKNCRSLIQKKCKDYDIHNIKIVCFLFYRKKDSKFGSGQKRKLLRTKKVTGKNKNITNKPFIERLSYLEKEGFCYICNYLS